MAHSRAGNRLLMSARKAHLRCATRRTGHRGRWARAPDARGRIGAADHRAAWLECEHVVDPPGEPRRVRDSIISTRKVAYPQIRNSPGPSTELGDDTRERPNPWKVAI